MKNITKQNKNQLNLKEQHEIEEHRDYIQPQKGTVFLIQTTSVKVWQCYC